MTKTMRAAPVALLTATISMTRCWGPAKGGGLTCSGEGGTWGEAGQPGLHGDRWGGACRRGPQALEVAGSTAITPTMFGLSSRP